MGYFLVHASCTSEAIAAMMENPEDRTPAVRSLVEKLGGTLIGFWFSLGENDALEIYHVPDNITAAAFSFAVSQTGRFKVVMTCLKVLITIDIPGRQIASTCDFDRLPVLNKSAL